jgi:hypothetical protein
MNSRKWVKWVMVALVAVVAAAVATGNELVATVVAIGLGAAALTWSTRTRSAEKPAPPYEEGKAVADEPGRLGGRLHAIEGARGGHGG